MLQISFIRDLKPENLVIGLDGHLKLIDFDLSKWNFNEERRTYSFCGTIEYIAPEIIKSNGHGLNVDWWNLVIVKKKKIFREC